jgi:dTDP-4-amino-4,6-dideoxygalactose transaminase
MMRVPFARVDCTGNEKEYVSAVLENGWLTSAGKARSFEKAFAERIGASHACAVNSCTAALHLAAEALGIAPGSKVFVPTMTFTASAEIIRYLGADPVFLDVEYGTCLITPEILQEAIRKEPDAKALVLVHYGGQAADIDGILELCRAHDLKLVEDAAHAFPTRYKGRMIGTFGDATCFSFYANKTMTTGEGGMLVTDDDAVYERACIMRLHGIDRDIWDRYTAIKPTWEYDVIAPGFKYNLTDIAAAIGLAQLERIDMFHLERQKCAEFYYQHLKDVESLDLPICKGRRDDHAWCIFPIVIKPEASVQRNDVILHLAECGIGTSVHFKPIHRMTYYRDAYGLRIEDYPDAERIWQGCISLPIYPGLTEEDLTHVCVSLKAALM